MRFFGPGNAPRVSSESSGMDGSHPGHLLRRLLKHSTGTKRELVACAWLSKKSEGNRIRECNETVVLTDPTRARFCTPLKGSIQPSSAFRWCLISSRHVHGRMPQRTWLAVANFQRDWSFRCYTASSFPAGGGDTALVRILVGWLDALKIANSNSICVLHTSVSPCH